MKLVHLKVVVAVRDTVTAADARARVEEALRVGGDACPRGTRVGASVASRPVVVHEETLPDVPDYAGRGVDKQRWLAAAQDAIEPFDAEAGK